MMFGSLLWAMADIWPNQEFSWTMDLFRVPIIEISSVNRDGPCFGIPSNKNYRENLMGKSMILDSTIPASNNKSIHCSNPVIGCLGITLTELYPVGQVEIEGRSYDAKASLGKIEKGENIKVLKKAGFELVVEKDLS